ncbi:MAG: hypothetical protein LC130_26230 [Bryobacterales bacterium]|nr:hypothetical protein [Bryobacterales bacterium]
MKASRIALVLAIMLAAGLRATARPTQPTAFEQTYAYDDRRLSRGATMTAKAAPLMLQSGSHPNRFAAFHVYDRPRRQVLYTLQEFSGQERDAETG